MVVERIIREESIHAYEITETTITLVNVHPNFEMLLAVERELEAQRERERLIARIAWENERDAAEFADWGTGHARAIRLQPDATVETDGDDDAGNLALVGDFLHELAGLQIDDIERVVRLLGDEESFALGVDREVVELAVDPFQRDGFGKYQRRFVGSESRAGGPCECGDEQ